MDARFVDMAGRDAEPVDAQGVDADQPDMPPPPDDCLPEPTCADGCPMPWLLAAIEDLPGGRDCGGRILRLSVAERDTACICSGYGAGQLGDQPFAVGFSPPRAVVTATEDGSVTAFDTDTARVRWDVPLVGQPVDIFALDDAEGQPEIGVATRPRGGEIRNVHFHDAATGGGVVVRMTNGDLPVGLGIQSMTQASTDRDSFRVLKSPGYAAADVNPWTNVRVEPPYTNERSGHFVQSVYAAYIGDRHRTVWTGTRTDLPGSPSRVWSVSVADDAGGQVLGSGNFCDLEDDGADYDVACDFLHAVPDPNVFNQSFALCSHPSGRRITRVRAVDRCLDLLDQDDLFPSARIARLALALPTYWSDEP